jgi:hypothetical protein
MGKAVYYSAVCDQPRLRRMSLLQVNLYGLVVCMKSSQCAATTRSGAGCASKTVFRGVDTPAAQVGHAVCIRRQYTRPPFGA